MVFLFFMSICVSSSCVLICLVCVVLCMCVNVVCGLCCSSLVRVLLLMGVWVIMG